MSEELTQCVARVFVGVLEDVAMIFGDEVLPVDLDAAPEDCMAVELRFTGSGEGSIKLMVPTEIAVEVAANYLGLDPGDPDAKDGAEDAIGELLNVVTGQLLTEMCGTEAVFDLSSPEVRKGVAASEWQELLELEGTVAVEADDCPIILSVEFPETNQQERGST